MAPILLSEVLSETWIVLGFEQEVEVLHLILTRVLPGAGAVRDPWLDRMWDPFAAALKLTGSVLKAVGIVEEAATCPYCEAVLYTGKNGQHRPDCPEWGDAS
eukprot:g24521.t1